MSPSNGTRVVVAVDDLERGQFIKVGRRWWHIEAIEEHPATRSLLLWADGYGLPWVTYKRRRTLVYMEIR